MSLAYGTSASYTSYPPNNNTPYTYSITPTGSNVMLIVSLIEHGATYPDHGSVNYAGNAMNFIDVYYDGVNTDTPVSLWGYYIGTPDGASHSIDITGASGTVRLQSQAVTITGAKSTLGNSGKNNGATTTPNISVTTSADNSMLVDGYCENGTAVATGTGTTTNRVTQLGNDGGSGWSGTTTTTTAGSYSSSYSKTGTSTWGGVAVEVLPNVTLSISVSDSPSISENLQPLLLDLVIPAARNALKIIG